MFRSFVCSAIAAFCVTNVHAMTLEVKGNQLFATGGVADDIRQFEEHLANPAIDTVVLVNSPGGSLHTGLRVGQLIATKGLKTITAGSCSSACSVMFMAGRERRFADTFPPAATFVGIHGAHNAETKQIDMSVQPHLFAFYKAAIGDKFDGTVMNQALYQMDDAGALMRVMESQRNPRSVTHHCKSAYTERKNCTEFPNHSPLALGIITDDKLVTLDLPASMRPVVSVFGTALALPIAATDLCGSAACQQRMENFLKLADSKAIATRLGTAGIGVVMRLDSPVRATFRALYSCNHLRNMPVGLCEVLAVNGLDARIAYLNAEETHVSALLKTVVPPAQHYGDEEFGGGFGTHTGRRVVGKPELTPLKITGVATVATKQLVEQMKSASPPVLIDVLAVGNDTIPSSHGLAFGGLHLEEAVVEAEYGNRVLSLLALLAPDKTRPIVFFCESRESWRSANAAQRAHDAGYTQVQWYRGGLASWKAANLPTAALRVRAVAN